MAHLADTREIPGSVRSTWGSYSQRIPPEAVTNVTNELLVGFDWCKTWGRKSATTSSTSTIFLSPSPKLSKLVNRNLHPIFGGTGSPFFGEHFVAEWQTSQPNPSHSRLVMDTCGTKARFTWAVGCGYQIPQIIDPNCIAQRDCRVIPKVSDRMVGN